MNQIQNKNFLKFLQESKTFYTGLHQVLDGKFYNFSSKYQVVWQHNNTRLLKFTSSSTNNCKVSPILFIPSLINRGYILDIMQDYSLVKMLYSQHICYLIDWGDPTLEESNYKFEQYYTNKVIKILDFISGTHKQQINLIGYCLGGIISILSTSLNADKVNKLVLIACPWDFSCYRSKVLLFKNFIDHLLNLQQLISSHFIRDFFLSFIPAEKIYKKFIAFASLATDDLAQDLFLRVEKWSLDNTFIANGIMREIIQDFVFDNLLKNNTWVICKKRINLAQITKKCFIVCGESDVVVPYISTQPLIKQLVNQHTILSSSGHVGILVGKHAKEWQQQLVKWLNS